MNLSKVTLNFDMWQQFMDIIIKYSTLNTKDDEVNIMLEILKNQDTSIGNFF